MTGKISSQSILTFDGSNYLDAGQNDLGGALAKGSATLTISGWVKPHILNDKASNHGTRNVFFARASDEKNDNLELGISPEGNLDVYIDENEDDITKTFGQKELTVGQWHFFSLVFNKGKITVYLDDNKYTGTFKGSSLDDATGSPVTIGATLHSDIYFSDQITHLSVWNCACSPSQIQKHRSGSLTGNEHGLTAYWILNEAEGDRVQDQTANGYDATLHGNPQWETTEMPVSLISPLSNSETPMKNTDTVSSSTSESSEAELANSQTETPVPLVPEEVQPGGEQSAPEEGEVTIPVTVTLEEPEPAPQPKSKPKYKILSIDGGGIRAIIPAIILAEIEKRTQKPIFSLFDLIAGTSTGGILALALVKPRLDPKTSEVTAEAQYRAEDLVQMYVEEGAEIFYEPFIEQMLGPLEDFLFQPKYKSQGREDVLTQYLGDTPLEKCLTEVFVTSYDIEQRIPIFCTSKIEKQQTESRTFRKHCRTFTLKDAGMATSAIPTYFAPSQVYTTHNNNGYYALVDGGLIANNPTDLAIMEARKSAAKHNKIIQDEEMLILSLGAGSQTEIYRYDEVKNWGLLQWTRPLLNLVFDGASEVVAGELERSLEPKDGETSSFYYRFQTFLTGAMGELDNTQPENIVQLQKLARRIIEERHEELDELCALLVS